MTSPYGGPQVAPQNAPPSAEYTVGVQPGTSGIIYANVVIVSGGAGSGVFVYSPTPGAGNLIGSWAGAAGTDQYGNAYPEGLNVSIGAISGTSISGGSITGSAIVADGSSGELLVYSGTPAAGNLIVALSGSAGSDAYGNSYLAGITLLDVNNSQIAMSTSSPAQTAPGKLQVYVASQGGADEVDAVNINAPAITGSAEIGGLTVASSAWGGNTNWGTGVYLGSSAGDIGALGNACAFAGFDVSGKVGFFIDTSQAEGCGLYAQNPQQSTFPFGEGWHYVGGSGGIVFGSGWANRTPTTTWASMAYRLVASPPNCVQLRGWVTASSTATTLCTFGTNYQPAHEQSFVSINGTAQSITQWNISTAGVVGLSFPSAAVSGDNYWIDTIFSLDI
jgi:hypothetical protein